MRLGTLLLKMYTVKVFYITCSRSLRQTAFVQIKRRILYNYYRVAAIIRALQSSERRFVPINMNIFTTVQIFTA